MVDIETLIRSAAGMDPLPPTVVRLARLVVRDNLDVRAVVETVALDPALSGRLLGVANSAAYRGRTEVLTVHDAVVRLGFGTMLVIAIGHRMKKSLEAALPEYGIGENDLWRHSIAAAAVTEVLSARRLGAVPHEAFPAAVLHDVGKVVVGRFAPAGALDALASCLTAGGMALCRAELQALGFTHAELGGRVAERWGVPGKLCRAVAGHHAAEPAEPNAVTDVVRVADMVACKIAPAGGDPALARAEGAASLVHLGLHETDVDALAVEAEARLAGTLAVFAK